MSSVKLGDKSFVPYINNDEIAKAISKVASEINAWHSSYEPKEPPIFVAVLSGAYAFTADLLKEIDFHPILDFIKVSSYSGLVQSGQMEIKLDIKSNLKGRDVIILDEIVDSGATVKFLKERFLSLGATSVAIATLIKKPHTIKSLVEVDYYGISMDDDAFLVGYGLDYNELGRTLSSIYILEE